MSTDGISVNFHLILVLFLVFFNMYINRIFWNIPSTLLYIHTTGVYRTRAIIKWEMGINGN